jgi:secreted trypsin-like serine protease
MKSFIVIWFLATVAKAELEVRITGGTAAKAGEVKCFVTIVAEFENIFNKVCGACLLAGEQSLITSAGCIFSATDGKAINIKFFTALEGPNIERTNDNKAFKIDEVYKFYLYEEAKNNSLFDVAIISLKDRIAQTSNLQGQGSIYYDLTDADPYVGEELLVCGHGFIDNYRKKPTTLQCTTLRVVPAIECFAFLVSPEVLKFLM